MSISTEHVPTHNGTGSTPVPTPTPAGVAPKFANAGPLGLCAFALTTFLLSMVNAKLVNKGVEPIVFGTALMFGGLVQVLAGMWAYRAGNTFAATAFSAYGGFWLSFWALIQFYAKDIPAAQSATPLACISSPGRCSRRSCSSPRSRPPERSTSSSGCCC